MADKSGEEKIGENKIIVDEDWKSQVKAEKEADQRKADAPLDASPAEKSDEPFFDGPLPPPTLSAHVISLASQATMFMGQTPNPQSGEPMIHLGYAKHLIDTIEMLEKKTHGNRDPEEISIFSRTLHELRLIYVAAKKKFEEDKSKTPPATDNIGESLDEETERDAERDN